MHIKWAICLLSVAVLMACSTKKSKQSPFCFPLVAHDEYILPDNESHLSVNAIKLYEAKHPNIPIPLGTIPLPECSYITENEQSQCILSYKSTHTSQELAFFYSGHMELCGWQEIARIEGPEILINYQNPTQWCTISIRSFNTHKNRANLVVFSGQQLLIE
jgi:hypothetical protein